MTCGKVFGNIDDGFQNGPAETAQPNTNSHGPMVA